SDLLVRAERPRERRDEGQRGERAATPGKRRPREPQGEEREQVRHVARPVSPARPPRGDEAVQDEHREPRDRDQAFSRPRGSPERGAHTRQREQQYGAVDEE